MTATWDHVIPRDFFNYGTLMNCLGKLQVAIVDCQTNDLVLGEAFDGEPFEVVLDEDSGRLSVANYDVTIDGRILLRLWTPYNSRDPYPLYGTIGASDVRVLDDAGNFCLIKAIAYESFHGTNPPCPHCGASTHVHARTFIRSEHRETKVSYRCSDRKVCGKVYTPIVAATRKKSRNRWAEMTDDQKSIALQRQRDRRAEKKASIVGDSPLNPWSTEEVET